MAKSKKHLLTKKQESAVALLAAACVVAAAVLVIVLSQPRTPRKGAFTPPPFEAAAQAGTPEVDAALGWSELAVREDYVVHVCGELDADGQDRVAVWFASGADNAVWVKLRLLDESGAVLGETGLLRPGEYVQYLTLTARPAADCPVTLRVMGYEPDTYYSAGSVALSTTLRVGGAA